LLLKSLRASVTSARSRRDDDHTCEHEHRNRGCRHEADCPFRWGDILDEKRSFEE